MYSMYSSYLGLRLVIQFWMPFLKNSVRLDFKSGVEDACDKKEKTQNAYRHGQTKDTQRERDDTI